MESRKLTPRQIHAAISPLRRQMLFTNSFTSDNNQLSRTVLLSSSSTKRSYIGRFVTRCLTSCNQRMRAISGFSTLP